MNTNINARDYLEKCGIKPSLQRIAVVEYLMENRIHPTADDIYHALCILVPTLSKTTVYNTLKLFAYQGAVQVLTIKERYFHWLSTIKMFGSTSILPVMLISSVVRVIGCSIFRLKK